MVMIVHKHRSIGKTIKKILISAGILLVLIIGAGTAYVYYSGKSDTNANITEEKQPEPQKEPTPAEPDPNGPVGASVTFLTSPARPGENVSMNVHTRAQAKCTIVVAYNKIVSKDSGLIEKTADIHGTVDWTWTVDKTAALGKWPVKVTCVYNTKSGFVQGDLEVIK